MRCAARDAMALPRVFLPALLRRAVGLAALGFGALAGVVGLAGLPGVAAAAEPAADGQGQAVSVPSLDRPRGGAPVQLPSHWFPASSVSSSAAAAPALVLLHGCGGAHEVRRDGSRRLGPRYTELAAALNAMGIHVLVTDSLAPRGEKELCTQRAGERRVTQLHRRRDALGALAWLAAQPGVDAARLGLLGWSNGGSTVLAATNLSHPEVRRARPLPSLAVAFYPGCEAEQKRGYRPSAPLLMLLGEADDWTPAAPCKAMAEAAMALASSAPSAVPVASGSSAPAATLDPSASASSASPGLPAVPSSTAAVRVPVPQWESYPGAHHGFDGTAPVRLRRDVPNGVNPGQGVHVGGQPEARAAARARLQRFLRETWGLVA